MSVWVIDMTNTMAAEIGELIRTQHNRMTDQPLFIVQQKVREWGYNSLYCDDYTWIDTHSGDWGEADSDEAERLEGVASFWGDCHPFEKVYYKDRWEFVTACFTKQGCADYIIRNGHNLREPRIYACSSYRNEEYRLVRNMLIEAVT